VCGAGFVEVPRIEPFSDESVTMSCLDISPPGIFPVALESDGKSDELIDLGRKVAMHVAAASPLAVDASGLDPAVVARERDVLAEKFRAQGKPDAMIGKIVESGLKTFYKEVCLLEQPYVHDDKKSVAQAVKEAEGKVGAPVKVAGFVRFALGEGIEK